MFVKSSDDVWINDHYVWRYVDGTSQRDNTKWAIFADIAFGTTGTVELAGLYANQAAAQVAVGKLVDKVDHGFDPSILVP